MVGDISRVEQEGMLRFRTEEPIKHECEVTSIRIMANPSELDVRLCSHLVGISRRKLGIVFCIKPDHCAQLPS